MPKFISLLFLTIFTSVPFYSYSQEDSFDSIFEEASNLFNSDKYTETLERLNYLTNNYDFPTDFTGYAWFYYQKACCEYEADNFKEAIVDFTKSIEYTKFKKSDYTNKSWKKSPQHVNILDVFIYPQGVSNLTGFKSHSYLYRAHCKFEMHDYYGTINDLKRFHTLTNDSNQFSNYFYAAALVSIDKPKLAIKYLTASINFYQIDGSFMTRKDLYSNAFLNRGKLNIRFSNFQKGCLDLSRAGELGNNEAYEFIEKYCR